NALLVPNRAIRTQNGKRIIYLMKNGQPTSTEITLGASSNTQSEVASGDVKEGDLIILNPPAQSIFSGGGGGGGLGPGGN
ncbi:MAG TPA: hypothetical protein VEQ10_00770, partial [Vicinamibacteria bacterium]|nr:hypothetical protein [Vicinamibacteria bacterium]